MNWQNRGRKRRLGHWRNILLILVKSNITIETTRVKLNYWQHKTFFSPHSIGLVLWSVWKLLSLPMFQSNHMQQQYKQPFSLLLFSNPMFCSTIWQLHLNEVLYVDKWTNLPTSFTSSTTTSLIYKSLREIQKNLVYFSILWKQFCASNSDHNCQVTTFFLN